MLRDVRDGVARVTLNRPDRLNSFTVAMHDELRAALERVKGDASVRVLLLTGAGRGFCAGQDLADRAVPRVARRSTSAHSIETQLPAAGAHAARAADAGRLRGQWRRGGRGCEHRAGLRHRRRSEVGEFHPGVLQDRADAGFRRHVVPAAPRRHGARDGPRHARRQAVGGAGGGVGPDLEVRRRRRVCGAPSKRWSRELAHAPTRGLAAIKRALHAAEGNTLAAQLDVERDLQRELGCSEDYREGVAAFLGKRPPQFTGR